MVSFNDPNYFWKLSSADDQIYIYHIFLVLISKNWWLLISGPYLKGEVVGNCNQGRLEGSLFNSYYTEV